MPIGINIPLILVVTKCKWKSAANQDFLSFCRLPLQTLLALTINATVVYWLYATLYLSEDLEEEGYKLLDWKEMFQFPQLIMCRSFIIAVKYGYYSAEHMLIFANVIKPKDLLGHDLISTALSSTDANIIEERF